MRHGRESAATIETNTQSAWSSNERKRMVLSLRGDYWTCESRLRPRRMSEKRPNSMRPIKSTFHDSNLRRLRRWTLLSMPF